MSSKSKWSLALVGLCVAGAASAEPPKEEAPAPRESKPVARPATVTPVENPALRPERMFLPVLPKPAVKPSNEKGEKPQAAKPEVPNPALRPEQMFYPVLPKPMAPKTPPPVAVAPRTPPAVAPRTPPVAAPRERTGLSPLVRITGEVIPMLQFDTIANLGEGPEQDKIRESIADADPKLNRALLTGRNFELLDTALFADSVEGVFVARGEDGKTNVVIRFTDGNVQTIAGLDLTDAEREALLRGSKPEKNLEKEMREPRGFLGGQLPFDGPFTRLAKKSDLLALLGQFKIEKGARGVGGNVIFGEGKHWIDYKARERRTPVAPAPRSKAPGAMGKSDMKETHGPEKR